MSGFQPVDSRAKRRRRIMRRIDVLLRSGGGRYTRDKIRAAWWGLSTAKDAERFLEQLRERFRTFGLELHPEKTRLVEFGRKAIERRRARGLGKPETFTYLA